MTSPFAGLKPPYDIILADPPTPFATHSDKGQVKSASQHYAVMDLAEIAKLPVGELANPAGCLLVFWSTWALVARGAHCELMRAWGFEPSSGGAWGKVTANGLPSFGTGYVLRDACEPFFIARRGKRLPRDLSRSERNLILAERREHSRKPEEMHAMIERLAPGARRLELFSRKTRPGWDGWGLEVGKFDEREAAE